MNNQQRRLALADFLKAHRSQLSPDDVGLPPGFRRRTPGLRREEVAQLAEVSTTWYTWLEQGRDINVSEALIRRIADALRLTPDERLHLFMLVHQQFPTTPPPTPNTVSPILQYLLDNQGVNPAYLTGRRCDILAWNRAAVEVFGDFGILPVGERNLLWLLFTNTIFRRLFVDWERVAQDLLAMFRNLSGRYIGDPWYMQYISDLMGVSPEFAQWWQRQEVCSRFGQHRKLMHPVVGQLLLDVTTLHVNGDPDLRLCVYTALPGSDTANKLHQLVGSVGAMSR